MSVANQLAEEFWEENGNYVSSDEFIPKARTIAHDIDAKVDRIVFITLIMSKVTASLEEHGTCGDPSCRMEPVCKKVLYYLQQELSRMDVVVDQDPFSSRERDAIFEKLEDILNELAQIKEGQGIVAQDVEDLKDLMYLGKNKWYKQYAGTVTGWVASGMVSEATAKPLMEIMHNALSQLPALPGS